MSPRSLEPAFPRRMFPLYVAQGVVTLGTTFLQLGFYFYAADQWGWMPRRNLLLAAAQGVAYVLGALSADFISRRIGRRTSVIVLPMLFAVLGIVCGIFSNTPMVVAPLLVLLSFLIASYWPGIESLVAAETEADAMSRRLAVYNLIWPLIGAIGTAMCGFLIEHVPTGFFYISAAVDAIGGVVIWLGGAQPGNSEPRSAGSGNSETASHATLPVEPKLAHQRTLALWLSRIALPSTYLVAYALAAIMPTLPSLGSQTITMKTVIGSIWLGGRWVGFCILAMSAFWQTRPRLLIGASVVMLLMFLGICIPISTWTSASAGSMPDLIVMSISQFILGLALALIYSASLYFGMVLSDGSTEHGGYHEALIGLGQVLGPGVAAGAQWIRPGSIFPATFAISALLIISLAASGYALMHFREKNAR